MAQGIMLAIIGMLFYFLKNTYQKVVLKKSDDEILLEKLNQEYLDSIDKWNLFKSKSKDKVEKEDKEMLKRISDLEAKIKNDKIKKS